MTNFKELDDLCRTLFPAAYDGMDYRDGTIAILHNGRTRFVCRSGRDRFGRTATPAGHEVHFVVRDDDASPGKMSDWSIDVTVTCTWDEFADALKLLAQGAQA